MAMYLLAILNDGNALDVFYDLQDLVLDFSLLSYTVFCQKEVLFVHLNF